MLLILIVGLLIWSLNSRGAIICYIFALSIYFFIILKDSFYFKIKFFTLIIITPILFFTIFNIKNKIDTENYNPSNSTRLLNKKNNNYSSGRIELWKYSINNYDINKIFGYGPQGDRYLLEEKFSHYGSNVSNGPLYALLSGGYFGFFFFILLYLRVILNTTITLFNPKLLRENYIVSCSVIFACFFLLRSTVENSFALFSIDFLIFIISNVLIEKFIKNKKIKDKSV
jgi:O-antigen ligase